MVVIISDRSISILFPVPFAHMPPLARSSPGTGGTQTSIQNSSLTDYGSYGTTPLGRSPTGNATFHAGGNNSLAVGLDTEGLTSKEDLVTALLSPGSDNESSRHDADVYTGPSPPMAHVTPTPLPRAPPSITPHRFLPC